MSSVRVSLRGRPSEDMAQARPELPPHELLLPACSSTMHPTFSNVVQRMHCCVAPSSKDHSGQHGWRLAHSTCCCVLPVVPAGAASPAGAEATAASIRRECSIRVAVNACIAESALWRTCPHQCGVCPAGLLPPWNLWLNTSYAGTSHASKNPSDAGLEQGTKRDEQEHARHRLHQHAMHFRGGRTSATGSTVRGASAGRARSATSSGLCRLAVATIA